MHMKVHCCHEHTVHPSSPEGSTELWSQCEVCIREMPHLHALLPIPRISLWGLLTVKQF